MKNTIHFLVLASLLLPACTSATPTPAAQTITFQYTTATIPWLAGLYNCAGANILKAEQHAADFLDPQSVDLAIRIGQPDNLTTPAYQIGSEEILVVVNPENPVAALTAEEVGGLFTGRISNWQEVDGISSPVQVWVFSTGEDIQKIFEQTTLGASPITSTARMAASPDEMGQAIANDVNAIGILARHWKTGNVADVYSAATAPVLALTLAKPEGAVQNLLACLQN
jgi:hypothetical protein